MDIGAVIAALGDFFAGIWDWQTIFESIPALLPNSVKVAHKTGWTGTVYHDTGIVYLEHRKPYAISIMTLGFTEEQEAEAHTCMAKISQRIYENLH